MSFEKADLEEKGLGGHVIVLNESSATVAEAAHALGVEPASIAKTLLDGPFLFAFRLLADIRPALGSGGCFQLLQGQLDGGVAVARCRVDGVELAQALVQIDRHALVHPKGAHTAGGMTHIGFHLIFQLPRSYSVMAQTRAGRPVAPSMRG